MGFGGLTGKGYSWQAELGSRGCERRGLVAVAPRNDRKR